MELTIKDIIQLFKEQSLSIAAGTAGESNVITSVNIMDAPDIENWAKKGDLILTTAYSIKDDTLLQEQLIKQLHARGCAGLGIKTKRFLPEIPAMMCNIANQLGFPLLELPFSLSFAEIMHPIMSNILDRQSYVLQQTKEIHHTLTSVVVRGGDLSAIINRLGQLTKCPAACYDVQGTLLHYWIPDSMPEQDVEMLKTMKKQFVHPDISTNNPAQDGLAKSQRPYIETINLSSQTYQVISCPIVSSHDFFGHISLFHSSNAFQGINAVALEQSCSFAALEFLKQKAIAESRRVYSRDMLECLLFDDSNQHNLVEIAATSKLAQAKYYKCLVLEPDHLNSETNNQILITHLYKITQQVIGEFYPLSLISEKADKIIVLQAAIQDFSNDQALYPKLQSAMAKMRASVSVGVGTVTSTITSIRLSFHDALTSLSLGRLIKGPGKLTYPYEVAGYSILSQPESSRILTAICGIVIDKLEHTDHAMGTEYLKTLEKFLETDKNITDTAKELYIHRNTLTNRLERIVDICNIDLNNREQIFCYRLALRQRKLLQKEGSR